jgi:hypothetical protein
VAKSGAVVQVRVRDDSHTPSGLTRSKNT